MKISFKIVPRLMTPSIDPGQSIEIDLYVSGYGTVTKNKLIINYNSPKLINQDDAGTISSNVSVTPNSTGNGNDIITGTKAEKITRQKIRSHSQHVIISPHYFDNFLDSQARPTPSTKPHEISRIEGETIRDDASPLRLKINTQTNAPSGDYNIDFILTYADDNEMYTDHKNVTIHVKNKMERYGWRVAKWGVIAGIIGTALSIIIPILINNTSVS